MVGGVEGRIAAGIAGAALPVRVARCPGWLRAGGGRGRRPGGSRGVQAAGAGVDGPRAPAWCWISGHRPERGPPAGRGRRGPTCPHGRRESQDLQQRAEEQLPGDVSATGPPPRPATVVLSPRATQDPGDTVSVPPSAATPAVPPSRSVTPCIPPPASQPGGNRGQGVPRHGGILGGCGGVCLPLDPPPLDARSR